MRRSALPALAAAAAVAFAATARAQTTPRAAAQPKPHATAMPQTATCRNTGDFGRWLEGFKKDAMAQGISAATWSAAAPYLTLDQNIIWTDRGQRFFGQSFLDFSDKLASRNRIQNGVAQIAKHKALFARAEKELGIPAPVITAFWALESDFGSGMG